MSSIRIWTSKLLVDVGLFMNDLSNDGWLNDTLFLNFSLLFFNFYVCSSFPSQKVYFVRWIPPTCCILLNATRVTWFPPIIHLHNLIFAVRFVHSSPILFYSFTSCSDLILATWSSIGEMFCLLDLQYLSTISLMSNFIPVSSRFCSNPVPNMSLHSPSSVAFPS